MKVSATFITILLLPLLLPQSHGIRMGKRITFFEEDEAQQMDQVVEARNWNSNAEAADIDDGHEGVHYSCQNAQCKGKKRKLLIAASATTSSSSKAGHGKAEFSTSSSTTEFEGYHDLAGMDYSPAKRRPPIHN